VTLSCGGAAARRGPAADLLRRADAAQYEAKHAGYGVGAERVPGEFVAHLGPESPPAPAVRGSRPARKRNGARRSFRDRGVRAIDRLVRDTLATLDGELAQASVEQRLRCVVARFADLLEASAWGIASATLAGRDKGATTLATIHSSDGLDLPLTPAEVGRTGGVVIDAGGEPTDATVNALLAARGHGGAVAVTTATAAGTYVSALFTSDAGPHLRGVLPELRLLLLAAVADRSG
jgi:hypothetical protein